MYLIGAGGHGKVVAEALAVHTRSPLRYLDRDPGRVGSPFLDGRVEPEQAVLASLEAGAEFFVAIGDPGARRDTTRRWLARGHHLVRVLHSTSFASPSAEVGDGSCLLAGAILQAGARIGRGVIVNTAASVDHDCRVADYAHLAPGVRLAGCVEIGEGTWVGIGAIAREGISIGARTLVGAGSVIVEDIPDAVVAFGNPCRVVRRREDLPG